MFTKLVVELRYEEIERNWQKANLRVERVYCGAYQIEASAVRELAVAANAGISTAEVIHHIEDGEIAHTAVKVQPQAGIDIETTKTAIIDRLSNVWRGPLKHCCDWTRISVRTRVPSYRFRTQAITAIGGRD